MENAIVVTGIVILILFFAGEPDLMDAVTEYMKCNK